MVQKLRADALAHAQDLAESKERAERLIMAGQVFLVLADGRRQRVDKPGDMLRHDAALELASPEKYVSRGGHKLETALTALAIDPAGLVCLDAGASTGGFTDCLLQHGAARVYAVDVGQAQLHERLKTDPRVQSIEGVNLRLADQDLLPEPVDLCVADLSFISLTKVLIALAGFVKDGGRLVTLVKPQFELSRAEVRQGVVRDQALQAKAVEQVTAFARELGLTVLGCVPSALKGPKGNQEYLLYLQKP